ncbi:MAG: Abi family protein [candidate division SR1 bacterium]|nr:Abi family protein [candidate division SR1 bacterium]
MYTKPVKTIAELLEKLKEKGFIITPREEGLIKSFLENTGYYHVSSYMKSFFDPDKKEDKVQKKDIPFGNVINLYRQDRKLQSFLIWLLLHIEVFLKAKFIHITCEKYGSPFWYLDQTNLFKSCDNLVNDIILNNKKSHILKNYKEKYGKNEPFPLWHIVEVASFGPFSDFFAHTKQEINTEFYKMFDFGEGIYYRQFLGWLHGLCRLRNRVAHSEISRSMRLLPEIKLPYIKASINSLTAYICLIYLFLKIENQGFADGLFHELLNCLEDIAKIDGLTFPEKQRIGINGKRKDTILRWKGKIDADKN